MTTLTKCDRCGKVEERHRDIGYVTVDTLGQNRRRTYDLCSPCTDATRTFLAPLPQDSADG